MASVSSGTVSAAGARSAAELRKVVLSVQDTPGQCPTRAETL